MSVPFNGLYLDHVPARHGIACDLPSPRLKNPAGDGYGFAVPLGQKNPAGQRPVPKGEVEASLQYCPSVHGCGDL